MKEIIVRDSEMNAVCVERYTPVMTENGWVDMVSQHVPDNYEVRGFRYTADMVRLFGIDDCPEQKSAIPGCDEMVPQFMSHRMWDNTTIKVLD